MISAGTPSYVNEMIEELEKKLPLEENQRTSHFTGLLENSKKLRVRQQTALNLTMKKLEKYF